MTATTAVAAKPVESKPASAITSQPIPFRKDSVTSTPEVFGLLLTTLLLVAVFAAVAWYARRRGWLDRWVGPKPGLQNDKKKIMVLEAQRISQKTTLYRISNGENEFLLAESSLQIQLEKLEAKKESGHD